MDETKFPQKTNVLIDDIRQITVAKLGSEYKFISHKDKEASVKIKRIMTNNKINRDGWRNNRRTTC